LGETLKMWRDYIYIYYLAIVVYARPRYKRLLYISVKSNAKR
jgi:hypothetical protein